MSIITSNPSHAIVVEKTKSTHLHTWTIAAAMVLGVSGLTLFRGAASGVFAGQGDNLDYVWQLLLASMSFAVALIYPVLLAVLASRVVDIEHRGQGWIMSATSSVTPGTLLRAKLIYHGRMITGATLAISAIIAATGLVSGASSTFPAGLWAIYTVVTIVVSLAVFATHLVVSSTIDNQLVCLAIGVGGLFLAVFGQALPGWLNHITPWGYFTLIRPADYVGEELVYFDLPIISVAVMAIIATAGFHAITAHFDRKEL